MRRRLWIVGVLTATSLVVAGLAACTPTDLAHQPISEPFPVAAADFDRHKDAVEGYISRHRVAVNSAAAKDEIALNTPFEYKAADGVPYRGKFLFIHGLNDSPFVWRDIAGRLSREGFDARAILLPGHGTRPGAMVDVAYEDWLTVARAQLEAWDTGDTPIYLGGFSLGGVIATLLALEYDSIAGLLLFAPAWRSDNHEALRWSSTLALANDWAFVAPVENPVRYGSISFNSGSQYYAATEYLDVIWGDRRLDLPVLVVVTTEDSVIDVNSVRRVFQERFPAPGNRLVIYSASGAQPRNDREIVRNGADPLVRILNQSHMSMMIAPDNPRYGAEGDLRVCNGMNNTWKSACQDAPLLWYGAWGTDSPDGVLVARTTYNPDFDFVYEQIRAIFMADAQG